MTNKEQNISGFIIPQRGTSAYRDTLRKARDGDIIKVRNGVYATLIPLPVA